MNTNKIFRHKNIVFIYFSFIIALILQILPWPFKFCSFKPSWVLLILAYWIITISKKINIGTGFLLGLVIDLITGNILGIHSLAFSIFAYLIICNLQYLNKTQKYKQIFIIAVFSFVVKLVVIIIDILINNVLFNIEEIFWGSVIDGFLWPYIALLMKNLKKSF